MSQPRVQVFVDHDPIPGGLSAALHRIGAQVSFGAIARGSRSGPSERTDAIVVLSSESADRHTATRIESLLRRACNLGCPTLIVGRDKQPAQPAHGPIAITPTFNEGEIAGHLRAMIALRPTLRAARMRRAAHPVARLAQRAADQLAATSALKQALPLPPLPTCNGLTMTRVARTLGDVGGDYHAVRAIDDDHRAVLLADAEGHGVPASILTLFVERVLRISELDARGRARLLDPGEVLQRLNLDLIATPLCETGFVAAIYAVVNTRTREVRYARGGAPYPLQRAADGRVQTLRDGGLLIGVEADAEYATHTLRLAPGDTLLLHTNGLDAIATEAGSAPVDEAPAGAALVGSRWYEELRTCGVTSALQLAADRFDTLRRIRAARDDLTILALTAH